MGTGRPPGNYNPHDKNGRFTKGQQYVDLEPNKDSNIARNRAEADERNGKSSLTVINSDKLNKQVLEDSLKKVEELQKELPQVELLIKEYNGKGTIIKAEGFLPGVTRHTSHTADGDTDPKTGIIGLNSAMRLSKENSTEDIIKACNKSGTFGKYGRALSSTDPRHTLVHEYGHIIQLALCCKNNKNKLGILIDYDNRDTVGDMISVACHKTGVSVKEFQKSLSSYAHTHLGETFSEAIANAVLAPQEANKTSLELWKMVKKQLG